MNKLDVIKTYIFEPHYYEYIKKDYSGEFLKIFNNNILYLYINIYCTRYLKIKQIKQNYIIYIYLALNNRDTKIFFTKIKNYDNTTLDIINDGYYDGCYKLNFDFRINNNAITKKIDKDIYIIYYQTKNIIKDINIKDINIKAIRQHHIYNSEKYYYKYYKTYYINYYIIINLDIKNLYNNTSQNCNTIFCNYSRNFMLFI